MGASNSEFNRREFLRSAAGLTGAAVVGGAGIGTLGAFGGQSHASTASGPKSITITITEDADTLDPGLTGLESTYQVIQSIFDPLYYSLPTLGNKRYQPGLATKYTVSPDAKQYTFTLRQGVTFHDGTPFNAAAVKANFDHIMGTTNKGSAQSIIGATYQDTVVVDDYTVRVDFNAPNASFIDEMAAQPFGMSSPAALTKYGSEYGVHPVGTGPFIFKEWVSGQQVTLARNPHYKWGPHAAGAAGPAHLDTLVYRVLTQASSQAAALRTGEIQIAQNLNPSDVTSLVQTGKYKKYPVPGTGMVFCYGINTRKSPTDDLKVRQALNYGANQKSIIQRLFGNLFTPAISVFDPPTPGFSKSQGIYTYDPKKANQLLEAAGWRKGSDGMRTKDGQSLSLKVLNITTFGEFGFDNMAQLLQAEYQQLGVQMTISDEPTPVAHADEVGGNLNLASHTLYDVSPYFIHSSFGTPYVATGGNIAYWSNPAFDQAVAQANATVNNAQRTKAYEGLGKEVMQQALILPLYDKLTSYIGPSSMRGWTYTVNAVPMFAGVTLSSTNK